MDETPREAKLMRHTKKQLVSYILRLYDPEMVVVTRQELETLRTNAELTQQKIVEVEKLRRKLDDTQAKAQRWMQNLSISMDNHANTMHEFASLIGKINVNDVGLPHT